MTHAAHRTGVGGNGSLPTEAQPGSPGSPTVGQAARKAGDVAVASAVTADGTAAVAVAAGTSRATERVDRLAARIIAAPSGGPPEEQFLLAAAARLLPKLRLPMNEDLLDEAEIAIDGILAKPPSLHLARKALAGIGRELRFRSYTPATRMLVGVSILSYFFAFGWLLAGGQILGLEVRTLVGPAVFGWLGSVASIVTRINKFRNVQNPITVGATRPILGSAFGIFTYLALTAGIINFSVAPSSAFYLAIAFVAGFSERFVPDLIANFDGEADGSAKGSVSATAEA